MTDQRSSTETEWAPPHKSAGLITLSIAQRYSTVGLILLLGVVFSFTSPFFLTPNNMSDILLSQGVKACMALAVLFPLIIGEFDLRLLRMHIYIDTFGLECEI